MWFVTSAIGSEAQFGLGSIPNYPTRTRQHCVQTRPAEILALLELVEAVESSRRGEGVCKSLRLRTRPNGF
jgi:hypothetical protein